MSEFHSDQRSECYGRWTGVMYDGRYVEMHEVEKGSGLYHCRYRVPDYIAKQLFACLSKLRVVRCPEIAGEVRCVVFDESFSRDAKNDFYRVVGVGLISEIRRYEHDAVVVCVQGREVRFYFEGIAWPLDTVSELGSYYSVEEEERVEDEWNRFYDSELSGGYRKKINSRARSSRYRERKRLG